MKENILSQITTECPWRDTLYWYPVTDSTNTQAKLLAKQGAPHGTVLIAGHQSAGRGRMGRSFLSREAMGVYLSVILRPNCAATELMHLTCAAGVAMCRAVERVSGMRPGIKWINDLVLGGKKLGGILTELSVDPKTACVEYAVVGIGINCRDRDFPPELEAIATSLLAQGQDIAVEALAAAMVEALEEMSRELFVHKKALMDSYRSLCVTLGQPIRIHRGDTVTEAKALDMDDDGALIAQLADGQRLTVNSGEVSVRGMYGYI